MSRKSAKEAYDNTVLTFPALPLPRSELATNQGLPLEVMEGYGLEKRDLKLLERMGLAVSGRLRTKAGDRVRWALIKEGT